jgi:molybdate transport system regulatory protein
MSVEGDLSASLILRRGALARVGLERIALVEAVGELGSITAAAKRMGLSYKGAWDAIQALNNLFDAPLTAASAGGKAGGAAVVTPRGHAVIKAFREVEREIGAALSRLEAGLAGAPDQGLGDLFWSLGLRTSARNALRGTVARLGEGAVTVEVGLALGDGVEIVSVITRHSVEELGLAVGKPAVALIKSSFVSLAREAGSSVNRLAGVIVDREDGAEASEIRLTLTAGKTLVATTSRRQADDLGLSVGEPVVAMIEPANVILAVE